MREEPTPVANVATTTTAHACAHQLEWWEEGENVRDHREVVVELLQDEIVTCYSRIEGGVRERGRGGVRKWGVEKGWREGEGCRGGVGCRGRGCEGVGCRGRWCEGVGCRGRGCEGVGCRGRGCEGVGCRGRGCEGEEEGCRVSYMFHRLTECVTHLGT